MSESPIASLEQLLDRIAEAGGDSERVSLNAVLEAVGERSFAPMLLIAGLVTLAPGVGDIPGAPTVMAALVLLTAVQLLFRRRCLWLPAWLLNRSVAREKLQKAIAWLQRPSKFIDRRLRPRLPLFHNRAAIATACIATAVAMPVMEFIPFSANLAGIALTAFSLSLLEGDGLLGLVAFTATAAIAGIGIFHVL